MNSPRAVLFDFSGTLARLEGNDGWFDDIGLDPAARAEVMDRVTNPSGRTSHHAWDRRDLDPVLHREVYLHALRDSGLSEEHSESIYGRTIDPLEWMVYPDTPVVLKNLRRNGIRTAVVSNIAWDIRRVLTAVAGDVDEFVLSFEVGAMKPDPRIFEVALDRLGVDAAEALMVGDSVEMDGAARNVGCGFILVDPLPIAERPTGLIDALRAAGVDLH